MPNQIVFPNGCADTFIEQDHRGRWMVKRYAGVSIFAVGDFATEEEASTELVRLLPMRQKIQPNLALVRK